MSSDPMMGSPVRRLFMTRSDISISRLLPMDALWLESWINDAVTTRFMAFGRAQMTTEQLGHLIMGWQEPSNWAFAVLQSDQVEVQGQFTAIGYAGLFDVDILTRKGELRILLGAPYCGKGLGTEATKLILNFGFRRLGLQRIWLGVTDANIAAVRAYEKCGFKREGILRRDLFRDGRFYDSIRMSILDYEYELMGSDACLTDEEKQLGTSAPGHATAPPACGPWMGFLSGEGGCQPTDPIPPSQ